MKRQHRDLTEMVRVTDLAFRDGAQGLDNRKLGLQVWGIIQESHDHLYHLRSCLLELTMLLRQQQDLLAQQTPIPRIFCYCADANEDSRGGSQIRGLVHVSVPYRVHSIGRDTPDGSASQARGASRSRLEGPSIFRTSV
jgi:hypothetical protein